MELLEKTFSTSGTCLLDVHADSMESTLELALGHLIEHGEIDPEVRDEVLRVLLEREGIVSTAIGHAVAIPHSYLDVIKAPLIVLIRLWHPINMGAPDGIPTHFVFLLLGNRGSAGDHLDVLAGIARLMSNDEFRYELGEARNGEALLKRWLVPQRAQPQRWPPNRPSALACSIPDNSLAG